MGFLNRHLRRTPLQPFHIDYPSSPRYASQKLAFCQSFEGEYVFYRIMALMLGYEVIF